MFYVSANADNISIRSAGFVLGGGLGLFSASISPPSLGPNQEPQTARQVPVTSMKRKTYTVSDIHICFQVHIQSKEI